MSSISSLAIGEDVTPARFQFSPPLINIASLPYTSLLYLMTTKPKNESLSHLSLLSEVGRDTPYSKTTVKQSVKIQQVFATSVFNPTRMTVSHKILQTTLVLTDYPARYMTPIQSIRMKTQDFFPLMFLPLITQT